eukprot:EC712986.1.p1 GENE.EC712986.1~~EC712986.1.p1  ORF type:complete len:54 (-),score=5.72 EC712986.1:39-200(-)
MPRLELSLQIMQVAERKFPTVPLLTQRQLDDALRDYTMENGATALKRLGAIRR